MGSPTQKTTPLDNDAAKGLVQLSSSSAQVTSIESDNVDCEVGSILTNTENDALEEKKQRRTSDSDSSKSKQDKSNEMAALGNDSDENTEEESSVVLDFGNTVNSKLELNVSSPSSKKEVQVDEILLR